MAIVYPLDDQSREKKEGRFMILSSVPIVLPVKPTTSILEERLSSNFWFEKLAHGSRLQLCFLQLWALDVHTKFYEQSVRSKKIW